jgi:hypothetical protein
VTLLSPEFESIRCEPDRADYEALRSPAFGEGPVRVKDLTLGFLPADIGHRFAHRRPVSRRLAPGWLVHPPGLPFLHVAAEGPKTVVAGIATDNAE